ncbi:MAG TPA: pilin [Candidatus Saccharibacteria bacterium]|nr:hypothetical protein [Candidatus Saccharibacteria bacterium]MCB9817812.1 hypothetical protein [Candidatus Nomurabacteria bacterium]HPR10447.1 pilin [Candidatus Saccharibacteria bacterium]
MKKLFLVIVAVFGLSAAALPALSLPIYASPVTDGINATCPDGNCQQYDSEGNKIGVKAKANNLVQDIINIFSWIVGVVSVIMVIFGGFRYITSGGDAGKVTSAKNTIVYALVGLVIAALAQVLVLFVLGNVT